MFHPGGAFMKLVYCLLLSFLGCSAAILASLSKNEEGAYDFLSSYIPFMSEGLKLVMSSWLLIMDPDDADKSIVFSASAAARYMILSFFYAVQNNVMFYTLKYIDAATFQVVVNLKIPLIAVLMYFVASKHFNKQQICGLVLLVFGSIMVQFNRTPTQADNAPGASFLGVVLLSCMIVIPSFATVFNELLLKQTSLGSMHWQNIQLYFFGCIFTFIKLYLDLSEHHEETAFQGFNTFAWLSVVNLGFLGLITSAVLKHADNILRSFSSVGSVFLAIYFSWMLLGTHITFYFFIGAVITCISIIVYTEAFKWDDIVQNNAFGWRRGFGGVPAAQSELANTRVVDKV